jgi:hypothetical protein
MLKSAADCGCNGGQPPSPEPAGGAVFGKSRKINSIKYRSFVLEQLGTPKKGDTARPNLESVKPKKQVRQA